MTQPELFDAHENAIPALTVCQPWAWALIHSTKRLENRTWETRYRGPLLIHAGKGKGWMKEGLEFIRSLGIKPPDDFEFGAILGMAELESCLPYHKVRRDPWAFGPICWKIGEPRALIRPLPYKGTLNLFRVAQDLLPELFPRVA